ncbi:hydrolytic protein [Saccharopolyspora indica]|uniref:COG1470 family protein n=1 Tax=Saccharopolyspora indica TaxID=1229659 RepID=UPI0022EB7F7C|nr:hydrolytic protein [Saccharopolyspora indica]MDA3642873.1 hydrolytic protein [Saccharopolyspora indica]
MTPYAELDSPRVEVSPGGEATTTLAVRNNTDIVEAYEFEVVGECAAWVTVEPARLPLYPGAQGTVTLVLRPPLSASVRAGEVPLAVRVVPVEQPAMVAVPETTVVIAPFYRYRASLSPQRRRAWRSGRFQVNLHNQGNTPVAMPLAATDPAEDLRFSFDEESPELEPGERAELRLRARTSGLLWFGKPVGRPFRATAAVEAEAADDQLPEELDGELVQLPLLPRWLLALLALLLALILFWLTLGRPTVVTAAREAAEEKTIELAKEGKLLAPPPPEQPKPEVPPGQTPGEQPGETPGGQPPGGQRGSGQQVSQTIEVRTSSGRTDNGVSERVPEGKMFYVTDLVMANYQGDEGLLTIELGDRTITTIALETFRNQDLHWVTPLEVTSEEVVTVTVRCTRPGTPPSGRQADRCVELVNVSGVLRDAPR